VFAAASLRVDYTSSLRGGHVRCTLSDERGAKLKAVAWRSEDSPIGQTLLQKGALVHVAGRLKPDDWNGRNGVELEIDDLADPRQCT
jgi:single-stranded-DNA-specific exonuclease